MQKEDKVVQNPLNISARAGGIAAMLSGVLWRFKVFHDRNDAPPWPTDLTDDLFFVVPLLLAVGFTGLYVRFRGRLEQGWGPVALVSYVAGLAGLTGSVLGSLTMTSEVGPQWWVGISWWMFVFGFFVTNLSLVFCKATPHRAGGVCRSR